MRGVEIDRRGLLGGIAACALMGGPAAAEDDALVAAAKAEGRGTLYAALDPSITQAVLDAFAKRYGISVELQRTTAGTLAQRFSAEQENGSPNVDLLITTDTVFPALAAAKGWLAPLASLPNYSNLPARARGETSVIVGHIPYSIVWNKTQIERPIETWRQLATPGLAGKLLLIDPRTAVNPQRWFWLMRKTYGDDFIRQLGKLCSFAPSAVPGSQQIAAGAAAVYAPAVHQVTIGLLAKGAPIDEAFPSPTTSSDSIMCVSAKAPHPNVARLLANFYLSVEAQQILNRDGFSPLPNVPGTRTLPDIVDVDPNEAQGQLPELLKLIGLS
jgi:iron(III) transport system substrate-binding protein